LTGSATPTSGFHLANFNIARMRGSRVEDAVMHGFTSRLDEINAIADRSPGFVWRLQTEDGDATAIRPYDDDKILINLSVWASVEALAAYVYRSAHSELVRDGASWFEKADDSSLVLWWIAAGEIPTAEQGVQRLAPLHEKGPSPEGFTFRTRYTPDGRREWGAA